MSICVVTNTPDNKTWNGIHNTGRLHLEAQNFILIPQAVSDLCISHNLIPRGNQTVMNAWMVRRSTLSLDFLSTIALLTGVTSRSWLMPMVSLEKCVMF